MPLIWEDHKHVLGPTPTISNSLTCPLEAAFSSPCELSYYKMPYSPLFQWSTRPISVVKTVQNGCVFRISGQVSVMPNKPPARLDATPGQNWTSRMLHISGG